MSICGSVAFGEMCKEFIPHSPASSSSCCILGSCLQRHPMTCACSIWQALTEDAWAAGVPAPRAHNMHCRRARRHARRGASVRHGQGLTLVHSSARHLSLAASSSQHSLLIEPCCVQFVTSCVPSILLHATESIEQIPQNVIPLRSRRLSAPIHWRSPRRSARHRCVGVVPGCHTLLCVLRRTAPRHQRRLLGCALGAKHGGPYW